MIDQAIILAAGLGTRMRPLTNSTPKPLIKVCSKTLIDHKIAAAKRVGIRKLVVNVHYLADQMERHLSQIHDIEIIISDERRQLMNSGGGIKKALPFLDNKEFYVLNSDAFWHGDIISNLQSLADSWNDEQMDILMGLAHRENSVGFPGHGDFFKDDTGALTRRDNAPSAPFAFSGDYILHPAMFDDTPDTPFSANILFDKAIKNARLKGLALQGLWLHVGTPQSIVDAEHAIALHAG